MLSILKGWGTRAIDWFVDALTKGGSGGAGQEPPARNPTQMKLVDSLVIIEVERGLVQRVFSNSKDVVVRVLDRDDVGVDLGYATRHEQEQELLDGTLAAIRDQLTLVW